MRRGVWLLILGVLAAALAAASARADGTTTTATTGTTTTTTTTGATTTTAASTYARLAASNLPAGCVGAGVAAITEPGRSTLAVGTPAYGRGPSAYPPVVRFGSSAASGSTCKTAKITLDSVSLFGGAVTATSVDATHGRGTVSGLEIDGSARTLSAGQTVPLGFWGALTLGKTIGRLTAPLVVQLLQSHGSLPAGTTVAVAFAAAARPVAKSKRTHQSSAGTQKGTPTPAAGPQNRAQPGHAAEKKKHGKKPSEPLTVTPPLGFKPSHYVFPVDGGADWGDTYGANRSDVSGGWHHGDDLFAPLGTPVVAVANGKLSLVGWNQIGGWRLWLTDANGNSFYYAHLAGYSRWILDHPNVRAGQVVGFLGRTGDAFTTTPHLHFEVHPSQTIKLGYDGAVNPTAYLQKWRIVHVPAKEMPQPAKLKAPVGAPAEEASVVWHQLLVARHLLHVTGPVATAGDVLRPFPSPLTLAASGESPLPIAGVQAAAAHVPASRSDVLWLVAGGLGAIVGLSAGAGAFTVRRRRRTAAETSS
jgi:murein DD-endopeptidase MepM/ murein hydrolase activator NlpD